MASMKHPTLGTQGSSGAEDEELDSPTSKTRPPRVTGLDAPHSRDQYISCTGHIVSGVAFYLAMGCILLSTPKSDNNIVDDPEVWKLILLGVHLACTLLLSFAWVSCERCNPGTIGEEKESSWLGVVLHGPRWDKTRYCAVCRKNVPGMDHHCTWLNTCIGRKNYPQFLTIAICGVVIFSIQGFMSVYCSSVWREWVVNRAIDFTVGSVAQASFIVCGIVSVPCLIMYTTLLAFHLYLSCLGYGTYDYFLKRRDAVRAERRRKRDAEIERTRQSIIALGGNSSSVAMV